ncbi:hypothetical protein [Burkholderia multivorans]|uniref:hypothetical protein n=1 Tax=Burkholderia multivorans TaxID=87883 RepID=UPI0009B6468C|nr:hypothetical protein [Burkholderia multivorans]MBJ9656772.1 hypothetical protein [Burkholderia multivorans]MBU9471090.1 hypothetical protein [Burkholderia multivorans]
MKARLQPPSPSSKTNIDPAVERAVLKAKCERDHLFFSRYFFKHRQAIKRLLLTAALLPTLAAVADDAYVYPFAGMKVGDR